MQNSTSLGKRVAKARTAPAAGFKPHGRPARIKAVMAAMSSTIAPMATLTAASAATAPAGVSRKSAMS